MRAPTVLHLEEAHGLDAFLAATALLCGIVGLVLVGVDAPRAGMALGAVGVLAGAWGQLISRARTERFADIVGLVAAALAFALGAAQGDLTFSG
jgi:hypothetical protein